VTRVIEIHFLYSYIDGSLGAFIEIQKMFLSSLIISMNNNVIGMYIIINVGNYS